MLLLPWQTINSSSVNQLELTQIVFTLSWHISAESSLISCINEAAALFNSSILSEAQSTPKPAAQKGLGSKHPFVKKLMNQNFYLVAKPTKLGTGANLDICNRLKIIFFLNCC